MAEFILNCKCGQWEIYQTWVRGCANRKHWVIRCKNCNAHVRAKKKERAIELWNEWDIFHKDKIHTSLDINIEETEINK